MSVSAITTPSVVTATVASTPAAITVNLGFVPSFVVVCNRTTGAIGLWWKGLTTGYLMVLNAGASGSGGTSLQTSAGVTLVSNTFGANEGFTFGTLTDFNDNAAEVLDFICWPDGMV